MVTKYHLPCYDGSSKDMHQEIPCHTFHKFWGNGNNRHDLSEIECFLMFWCKHCRIFLLHCRTLDAFAQYDPKGGNGEKIRAVLKVSKNRNDFMKTYIVSPKNQWNYCQNFCPLYNRAEILTIILLVFGRTDIFIK